jgi:hypothetical protein
MRLPELASNTWNRTRRPATWGAVLAFGLVWSLTRWGFGTAPNHWPDFIYPFALPFAYLALSPVPWQWTGDARPRANAFRGLLQAIPWNLVWVVGISFALGMSHGGDRSSGRRSGESELRMGPPMRLGRVPRVEPSEPLARRFLHPRMVTVAVANLSFALLLGWILADKERAEQKESDAVRAAAAAQARALQAQMNPHVLFNAIGGLTELVREDAKAAEEALVSLAGLLRSLLENGARPLAPLASERTLIEQYLALERIRLGGRLRELWEWDHSLEGRELPPLLLQPLVENAIKHGIAPNRGGGDLRIFLQLEGEQLLLGVANTGSPLVEGASEGIGLRNLRERLALLGERPDALRLRRDGAWTVAELCLQRKGDA